MGNLAILQELDLGGNQLSGEIPPELSSLANLTTLLLWHRSYAVERAKAGDGIR